MFAGDVDRAIVSVAFVSQDGVEHIATLLTPHADKITVFAGIRNDITSAQALKRLLEIGVSLYAVDTGTRMLLFHPKLYHVRAAATAKLSVGSANLTLGGLNNNIEAGVLINLSLLDSDDLAFTDGLEASFDGLAAQYPENVFHVTDEVMVNGLLDAGRLIDESTAPPPRTATKAKAGSTDSTPRMKMLPKVIRGKAKDRGQAASVSASSAPVSAASELLLIEHGMLLWEKPNLPESDLQLLAHSGNPGVLRLTQAKFEVNGERIDQRTYFRTTIFGNLAWVVDSNDPGKEMASVAVVLVISGVFIGEFDLRLSHKPDWAAGQGNYTTGLHWDRAVEFIRKPNLKGRTFRLFAPSVRNGRFVLEID
jgi:hypothetical protein